MIAAGQPGKLEGECSHVCVLIPCSDVPSEMQDLRAVSRMGLIEGGTSLELLFPQEEE